MKITSLYFYYNYFIFKKSIYISRNELIYVYWMCRCLIMNGKAQKAWDMCMSRATQDDKIQIMELIANDCYRVGEYRLAAIVFNSLDHADPCPMYSEGKRGACMGVMKDFVNGKVDHEALEEIITILESGSNEKDNEISICIRRCCRENGIRI